MSYGAMDWAFEQPIKDAGEKFVLIALAKHADDNMQCYPSIARLAKLTGFSASTVNLKIKALEQNGYLRVQRRSKNGKKTSNLYFLAVRQSVINISDNNGGFYNIQLNFITNTNTNTNTPFIYNDYKIPAYVWCIARGMMLANL